MPRKNGRRRRVRGSDGKLYDPKKQKDNGHRAHENRAQTVARRARWKSSGVVGALVGGVSRFAHGVGSGVGRLTKMLIVRPLRKVGSLVGLGRKSRSGRRR